MRARGPLALAVLLAVSACDKDDDVAPAEARANGTPTKVEPTKAEPTEPDAPADTNAEPAPEPEDKLTGFGVVVDSGAVFDRAEDGTPTNLPGAYARGFAVRIVGVVGDRVEVETLDATAAAEHCASPFSGLSAFRVRLFVARDELAEVLRVPQREDFDDGTSLSIMPGAVVGAPDPEGGLRPVFAGGVGTLLKLDDADFGEAYDAPKPFSLEAPAGRIPSTTKAEIGDGRVVVAGQFAGADDDPSEVGHFGISETAGAHFVRLRNQCVEAVARLEGAPPDSEDDEGDEDDLPMGVIPISEMRDDAEAAEDETAGPAATTWRIEPGTKIVWPDSRPAGEVVAAHELHEAPEVDGAASCFDAPLVRHHDPALRLCVASSQITKVEPAPAPEVPAAAGTVESKRGPKVKGALDKKVVKDVVTKGQSAVKACYENGLVKDPKLAGTVSVQFVISPKGTVPASVVAESDLSDTKVANCIARAVKTLKFPAPKGGGNVVVTYPFVLRPS